MHVAAAETYWTECADLWCGDTVVIIAGGSSVDEMLSRGVIDAVRQSGCRVMAVNDSYRLAPWADLLYFADRHWWDGAKGRRDDVRRQFLGTVATCSDAGVDHRLRNTGIEGYDSRPGCVRTGNNSGYQAMHLALQMGVRRMLLLGFDMRVAAVERHHWGDRPEMVSVADFHRALQEDMLPLFRGLRPEIQRRGVTIWNASPGSALHLWPVIGSEEVIKVLQSGE